MNQLAQSLFGAADFPKNLIGSWTYAHHLQDYYQLLNQHEDRLFCDDSEPPTAAVDLWDWEDPTRGTRTLWALSLSFWRARAHGPVAPCREQNYHHDRGG